MDPFEEIDRIFEQMFSSNAFPFGIINDMDGYSEMMESGKPKSLRASVLRRDSPALDSPRITPSSSFSATSQSTKYHADGSYEIVESKSLPDGGRQVIRTECDNENICNSTEEFFDAYGKLLAQKAIPATPRSSPDGSGWFRRW